MSHTFISHSSPMNSCYFCRNTVPVCFKIYRCCQQQVSFLVIQAHKTQMKTLKKIPTVNITFLPVEKSCISPCLLLGNAVSLLSGIS